MVPPQKMFMKIVILTAILAMAHDGQAQLIQSVLCDVGTLTGMGSAVNSTRNNAVSVVANLGLGSPAQNTTVQIFANIEAILDLLIEIGGSSSSSTTGTIVLNVLIELAVLLLEVYINLSTGGGSVTCSNYTSAISSYNSSAVNNITSYENAISATVMAQVLGVLNVNVELVLNLIGSLSICLDVAINLLGINIDADVGINL